MERAKRNVSRAQLTKAVNAINSMLEGEHNLEEVCAAVSKLKLVSDNLKEADRKMEPLLEENFEEEFLKAAEYEETTVAVMSRLEYRKGLLEGAYRETSGNNGRNEIQSAMVPAVKLQPLQLIKFDGSPKGWIPFWEQFRISVDENRQLSKGDKFNYLRMGVTGKAAEAIEGFPPSGAFYEEALKILRDQFGDPERLINQYLEGIMKLDSVRSKNDMETLRKNYNLVTSTIRSLKVLEVEPIQYNIIVKSSIIKSLPTELKLAFFREQKNSTENSQASSNGAEGSSTSTTAHSKDETDRQVQNLLLFVKNEVESLEQALKLDGERQVVTRNAGADGKLSIKGTATNLLPTRTQQNCKTTCFFCNKEHLSEFCDADLPLERKKELLRAAGRCYRCTKANHSARQCRNRYLSCKRCKGRHATSLCNPEWSKGINRSSGQITPASASAGNPTSVSSLMAGSSKNVLLQTACVYAGKDVLDMQLIRLVMDGGSQMTFITENVSRVLGLPVIGQHNISIAPFGQSGPSPARLCNQVLITLKGQYNDDVISLPAIEVPEICMDSLSIPNVHSEKFHHLQLADRVPYGCENLVIAGINVLIGADNYWAVVSGRNIRIDNTLVAVETKFGYALHGPIPIDSASVSANLGMVLHATVSSMEPEVEKLWNLETIGISDEKSESNAFFERFAETGVKKLGDRYEVMLPWKDENARLDDNNYVGARVRADKLKLRLQSNNKLVDYNNAIKELLSNDYAEIVNRRELDPVDGRVYYMPHRPVFREDKDTTKLRIVFDASSRAPGSQSLNDLLDKGPNLNPDLIKILLNFRIGTIGMTADIEKAFLQILLSDGDKNVHRFLWFNDNGEMQTYRMTRVTFGVTCSPFLLNLVIQKHLRDSKNKDPRVVETLQSGFYVDDLVISVNDHEFAMHLKDTAIELFCNASMNLRKWMANDFALTDKNPTDETVRKVLGINWHIVTDRLNVDLRSVIDYVNTTKAASKRNVLQTIARVYDPLGLITPFYIKIKILFQRIWKEKIGWDNLLTSDFYSEWNDWIRQLVVLVDFSVPRCIFASSEIHERELHVFADASLQAYGVVAYVRSKDTYGNVNVSLLCSKVRVAPLKNCDDKIMTLPRLELTAALLAARLQKFVALNISVKFDKIVCWTDSQITLYWIKGDPSKWKPYVSNRVKEIQGLTNDAIHGWYHCPGRENPADLLTRGISAKSLMDSTEWLQGPWWLHEDEDTWPKETITEEHSLITTIASKCLINQVKEVAERCPLIDVTRFSSLNRLLRVTAYVLRFIANAREKPNRMIGNLSLSEIRSAEAELLKDTQYSEYSFEINCLRKQRDSKILTLRPFLDDKGLLRLQGRLQNHDSDFDTKHPVLLPKSAYLCKLIIRETHERLHHIGVNATLCEVRRRFWIVSARQVIKSTLAKCTVCKRLRVQAASVPFAPLPKDRVLQAKPFEITGMDFAGPLYYKENNDTPKGYVFLFTCAVTRALHLELVLSMNVATSILAMKRFVARRGIPKTIYSDNAKTFKRLAAELQSLNDTLNSLEFANFMTSLRIEWKFIVERAAWWGGFWERLVKSVKDALKSTVGRCMLNRDELTTLIAEIEATINARPLTYQGTEPSDLLALTPAHFLLGPRLATIPSFIGASNGNLFRKQWRQRNKAIDFFWRRWSTEYLQLLRGAHHNKGVREYMIKVGDVVLVHGNDTRRLLWKLGVITEVIPGRDGKVRACYVRCANGVLRRPIQLLYPLEVTET